MPWDRVSRRRAELPPDWPIIRRDVLERDEYICQIQGERCVTTANEVDHIGDRFDHSRANLRAACTFCHGQRSAAQGHDAMRALRAKAKHPVERNPGAIR